jgi:hypothetical protein
MFGKRYYKLIVEDEPDSEFVDLLNIVYVNV